MPLMLNDEMMMIDDDRDVRLGDRVFFSFKCQSKALIVPQLSQLDGRRMSC